MEGAIVEYGLNLQAVKPKEYGEGLPYAPINFPDVGDNWSWKVGSRVQGDHFKDRYLYPPSSLGSVAPSSFKSKSAVERFIKDNYPDKLADFMSSFSWKIPAGGSPAGGSSALNGYIDGVLYDVPISMDVDYATAIGGETDKSISLPEVMEISSDLHKEYRRLDEEMDEALRNLRSSQEREYRIAVDTLTEHRRYLHELLTQLEKDRKEVALGNHSDTLINNVLDKMKQVRQAKLKMKELEKVKNGFAKMPTDVLNRHFGMNING